MQHFTNQWSMQIFFTSGIGLDILMKEQPGFCLIYILNKDKEFQSCALLEIPSSPPFMNEFHQ